MTKKRKEIMEIKKFEAYEMDIDMGDMGDEHAKSVISDFIDNELKDKTLEECFEKMAIDNDLDGADGGTRELRENVKVSLINYLQDMLDNSMKLKI